MTASPESASADQDESGCSSSAEPDIPPEPPQPASSAARPARPKPTDRGPDPHGPPGGADVNIAIMPGVEGAFDHAWLAGRFSAALKHIPQPVQRVSVLIVNDERMTDLNRHHLGVEGTTDVLAFPAIAAGEAIDADIAICADAARRQAEKRGHRPDRELLLYALHGLLHCAGFDDRTESAAAAMHAEEDRILGAIGVGPMFAGEPSPRAAEHAPAARTRGEKP
jgi:rRNA maturation RNase YbeY